ncbi:hypothetical protein P7K49_032343, partial [Saguinus oedipus]
MGVSCLRGALQDALRRLLGLFGETLRAAITLRSRIGERVGLCLDDTGTGLALSAGECARTRPPAARPVLAAPVWAWSSRRGSRKAPFPGFLLVPALTVAETGVWAEFASSCGGCCLVSVLGWAIILRCLVAVAVVAVAVVAVANLLTEPHVPVSAHLSAPVLEETWSDAALPELDRTISECAEMSSVAEISSHMRESFLMSPESVRECEQPIRRVFQSLSLAVDRLLEMALDSSRQLEEARQIHSRFEKEFSFKNEETAQVVRKHQELLECLKEESAAKAELTLQLHKTRGTLEGFKVETADLQKALAGKEDSEHRLVLELESLRRQLQQAVQEQAALREECARLWSQGEAAAADAEAREAGEERGHWRAVRAVGHGRGRRGFPSSQGCLVSLEGQV